MKTRELFELETNEIATPVNNNIRSVNWKYLIWLEKKYEQLQRTLQSNEKGYAMD